VAETEKGRDKKSPREEKERRVLAFQQGTKQLYSRREERHLKKEMTSKEGERGSGNGNGFPDRIETQD